MSYPFEGERLAWGTGWSRSGWLVLAGIVLFLATPGAHGDYIDGFEAGTLNPFWSTNLQSGSITLSTAQAHSGSQSAQFSTTSTGSNMTAQLFHSFSSPTFGSASVWIYDTGAGVSSSNYIGFEVSNQINIIGYLTTFDYGFQGGGPGRGDQYDYQAFPGLSNAATGITRTLAWHQFTISDTLQALTLMVDGTTVYTGAGGTPFNQITLNMNGPSFRPGWTSYFDDFSFVAAPASVPEPRSLVLASIAASLGFAVYAWKRHRRSRPLLG